MTREMEEAVETLKKTLPYTSEFADARNTAIKSLEAWDEVIKHLETTISEIKSTEMDQDCTMFCNGLTFAVAMIKNHLKEVDNG